MPIKAEVLRPWEGLNGRLLELALWAAQIGLAYYFVRRGLDMLALPWDELGRRTPWLARLPAPAVTFLAYLELFCAAGLLIPALLRVLPALVQASATALGLLMALSAGMHLLRPEESGLALRSLALAALAFGLALARHFLRPIRPRT